MNKSNLSNDFIKASIIDGANKIIEKADFIAEEANKECVQSVSFCLTVGSNEIPTIDMEITYATIGDEIKKLHKTYWEKL